MFMRLSQYLSESRSVEISYDEALKFFIQNFVDESTILYRGIYRKTDTHGIYIVDPSKHTRVSKDLVNNYYTLLIDNLPSWKEYPKRSKSVICTTCFNTACIFGSPYFVIPEKHAKLGICRDSDFWLSFPKLGGSIKHLNTFLNLLFNLHEEMFEKPENYKEIIYNLNTFDENVKQISEYKLETLKIPFLYEFAKKFIDETLVKGKKAIDVLNNVLNPKDNGFSLKTYDNLRITRVVEIWTDSRSLVVSPNIFEELYGDMVK